MLFRLNETEGHLEAAQSTWVPSELNLERYLITQPDKDASVMSESVFGEPLLLVRNQVRTDKRKRADILALDRAGNGTIIELKRYAGRLGIETQALQYLADFSNYKGKNFVKKFSGSITEDTILSFVDPSITIDDINLQIRIILVARSFDESVFALGEWLSTKGVAFRCISYQPLEIGNNKYLSFSVAFDRSPEALYPLAFSSTAREPRIFWHNIAYADDGWWSFLVDAGQVPACFEDSPGDQGEKILTKYIPGDKIVAYATGYGAVGWGVIENPKYRLIATGDKDDRKQGKCRHRITVKWQAAACKMADAVSAEEIKQKFGIYHPIRTSVSVDSAKSSGLLDLLSGRFGNR